MGSRAQVRREITELEAQLDSNRQLLREERARTLQKVELVRNNLPVVLGGALAGGLAAGLLSRKCKREAVEFLITTCQSWYRR